MIVDDDDDDDDDGDGDDDDDDDDGDGDDDDDEDDDNGAYKLIRFNDVQRLNEYSSWKMTHKHSLGLIKPEMV